MELSVYLKKLRESRGLSIRELAKKSGVGNGTIGDIERGANKARTVTLEKLSKALELTKDEKEKLFSTLLPKGIRELKDERIKTCSSREKRELEDFVKGATLYFSDTEISDEDKKKVLDTLTELYFEAKALNKRKK